MKKIYQFRISLSAFCCCRSYNVHNILILYVVISASNINCEHIRANRRNVLATLISLRSISTISNRLDWVTFNVALLCAQEYLVYVDINLKSWWVKIEVVFFFKNYSPYWFSHEILLKMIRNRWTISNIVILLIRNICVFKF